MFALVHAAGREVANGASTASAASACGPFRIAVGAFCSTRGSDGQTGIAGTHHKVDERRGAGGERGPPAGVRSGNRPGRGRVSSARVTARSLSVAVM
jgi:hypothetical protein